MTRIKETYRPWIYLLCTFVISWTIWFAGMVALPEDLFTIPLILGAFGPFLGAWIVTRVAGGPGASKVWLKKLFNFRIGILWYLLAALILPFATAFIHHSIRILTGAVSELSLSTDWLLYPVYMVLTALLSGGNEEPGWRGYLTPALEKLFHPVVVFPMVAFFWASWHLPLYLQSGWGGGDQSFFWLVMYCIPLSFILSWLYKRAKNSIIPAMLFHGAGNVVFRYFPVQDDVIDWAVDEFSMIKTLVYWLLAIIILLTSARRPGGIDAAD